MCLILSNWNEAQKLFPPKAFFKYLQVFIANRGRKPIDLFSNGPDMIGFKATAASNKSDTQIVSLSSKFVNIPSRYSSRLQGWKRKQYAYKMRDDGHTLRPILLYLISSDLPSFGRADDLCSLSEIALFSVVSTPSPALATRSLPAFPFHHTWHKNFHQRQRWSFEVSAMSLLTYETLHCFMNAR